MLKINQLSYWERDSYINNIDFLVIGSGIVGSSTAIHLRKKYPDAKIVVLERSYLPSGASTKNAGFACFGSPTELLDDLSHTSEMEVWSTVQKRWEGLQKLIEFIGKDHLELYTHGSWDLIKHNEVHIAEDIREQLPYLNNALEKVIGQAGIFMEDQDALQRFGFSNLKTAFHNRLEGQINTGKMMRRYHQLLSENNILLLSGIEVSDIENNRVLTNIGEVVANQVIITVNGFASRFLQDEDVLPARAQVLITQPIKDLKVQGTFHYQQGYYYFRNIDNRILLGGGRNLDKVGETTTELNTTPLIQDALKELLETIIVPNQKVEIDYTWAGVMGVGMKKSPIVRRINEHVVCGVRLGGMGVALGTNVGKEISDLL